MGEHCGAPLLSPTQHDEAWGSQGGGSAPKAGEVVAVGKALDKFVVKKHSLCLSGSDLLPVS